MEQLRFSFYEAMVKREACLALMKAALIDDGYDKKNYPRCLNDLIEEEMIEFFGEGVFNGYRDYLESGVFDNQKKGHLVILGAYKKSGNTMFVKKIVLDASLPEYVKDFGYPWAWKPGSPLPGSEWQREMVCDLVACRFLIPEESLHSYVFNRASIKQLSRIFQCPEIGVKVRLVQYYYDNVVSVLEKHEEVL